MYKSRMKREGERKSVYESMRRHPHVMCTRAHLIYLRLDHERIYHAASWLVPFEALCAKVLRKHGDFLIRTRRGRAKFFNEF